MISNTRSQFLNNQPPNAYRGAVRKDPSDDQFRSEILVRVVQAATSILFRFLVWHQSFLDDFFEFTVDVGLRQFVFKDFDGRTSLGIRFLGSLSRGKSICLIGAFGSPGDIVPVTESVDVEDIDV